MKRSGWWVLVVVVVVVVGLLGRIELPGTHRGAIPGLPGQRSSAEPGLTRVTLDSLAINGMGRAREAVVGNGGSVVLNAGYSVHAVLPVSRLSVRLERRIGSGAWRAVGTATAPAENTPLEARTPPFSTSAASAVVEYRFASDTSHSFAIRVRYENQHRYTGMAARMYRYAEPYCPHTAVHVTRLKGREAGLYETGALLIRIDSSVGVTSELPAVDQRAVAVHECSHELQWLNYGGTVHGHAVMAAAAAKYFTAGADGAPPIEHAADCGAKAVNPGGYLGYGGACTASELAEGKRLLAGQRY